MINKGWRYQIVKDSCNMKQTMEENQEFYLSLLLSLPHQKTSENAPKPKRLEK